MNVSKGHSLEKITHYFQVAFENVAHYANNLENEKKFLPQAFFNMVDKPFTLIKPFTLTISKYKFSIK